MARVVISVLSWDRPRYLAELLASLFETAPPSAAHEVRVYLLDQGSRDPAVEAAWQPYREQLRQIRLGENVGFPAGQNRIHREALAEGGCDFFCPLNSDVVLQEAHWLDGLLAPLVADPQVAVAGPVGLRVRREPGRRRGHGWSCSPEELAAGRYDFLSGSLCAIRQEAIAELGLFDEAFTPGYFEDADLCLRYRAAGYALAVAPVAHEHARRGRQDSVARRKADALAREHGGFMARNRDLFLERWGERLGLPPEQPWWRRWGRA